MGDATGELGPFMKSNVNVGPYWGDYADFVDTTEPFFYRGGNIVDNSKAGIFSFAPDFGGITWFFGFRITLTPTSEVM